jgi:hypothetical protein
LMGLVRRCHEVNFRSRPVTQSRNPCADDMKEAGLASSGRPPAYA